jgi:hypothetical protein
MSNMTTMMRRSCVGLLCLSALWLTGCGGGGNFASSSEQTVSGSVQSASGAPLSGYRVVYDPTSDLTPGQGSGLTTTTDSQGRFALSVLPSQITGHDTVSLYDSTGSLVSTASVVPGGAASVITVIPPTPPAPPA